MYLLYSLCLIQYTVHASTSTVINLLCLITQLNHKLLIKTKHQNGGNSHIVPHLDPHELSGVLVTV